MHDKQSFPLSSLNGPLFNPAVPGVAYFEFWGLSAYPELAHFVFTRHGGVSDSAFRSLNVSSSTGDSVENVEANLSIIRHVTGATTLVSMNQVHGKTIAIFREGEGPRAAERRICGEAERNGAEAPRACAVAGCGGSPVPHPPGASAPGLMAKASDSEDPRTPVTADAMITNLAGKALLVKQADCQAVILYDPIKKVISNVHCGWRGNAHGLLGRVIASMKEEFGCDPARMRAAIGPSLGPCCAEFVTHEEIFPESFRSFMTRDSHFDLRAISRFQLLEAGLQAAHIEAADCCTRCRTDLFFSYRGEGRTGRFATVVMLRP